jgi:hypothetical protein
MKAPRLLKMKAPRLLPGLPAALRFSLDAALPGLPALRFQSGPNAESGVLISTLPGKTCQQPRNKKTCNHLRTIQHISNLNGAYRI